MMKQQALEELEQAARVFKDAINRFQETFDPDTVGLREWCEHIDDVLCDIDQELNGD